jgi:hypothetical protein
VWSATGIAVDCTYGSIDGDYYSESLGCFLVSLLLDPPVVKNV